MTARQAVLKIVKHCREVAPIIASGQIVGLDVDGRMEITNVFPMPRNAEDADGSTYLSSFSILLFLSSFSFLWPFG